VRAVAVPAPSPPLASDPTAPPSLADPSAASDEDLAGRAADGDLVAFERLVERFGAAVIAALERLIGDHHLALDAAQEVWVKVHRHLHRYQRGARVRPWLFAIALNHGRDLCRKRGRRPDASASEELDHGLRAPRGVEPTARVFERGAIASALGALDERFREALVLVDAMGLGYDEAAESLGVSLGTVKSRVHRGRVAFRELWTEAEAGGTRTTRGALS